MPHWLELILWTFVPALELRWSIPFGVYHAIYHWGWVVLICVVANIILGFVVFWLLEWIIKLMTLIKPIERLWQKYVERTQKKIHAAVEKYGEWAVAIFIGIPLPGSGVYSGALASYLIGLPFRKFIVANILGVLIAATVVTLVSVLGIDAVNFLIKR